MSANCTLIPCSFYEDKRTYFKSNINNISNKKNIDVSDISLENASTNFSDIPTNSAENAENVENIEDKEMMFSVDEIINILKVAAAEVEWNYPLDYKIAIDEAIVLLKKLK